jgi:transposase
MRSSRALVEWEILRSGAIVIKCEIGPIDRFDGLAQFTSYAGLVPTGRASGGKPRFSHMCKARKQYLRSAFVEVANALVCLRDDSAWKTKHVCEIHEQISQRKGHAVAVDAVARHLAVGASSILKRR